MKASPDPSEDLSYVTDEMPGIRRLKSGKGFTYRRPDGQTVRDRETLARIRSLVIPPAWVDVWISTDPKGHLQATGRDARGRKQYRYHPSFREARESAKFEHMVDFAAALPRIRAAVAEHLSLRGLPREKVLATVVYLLETTLIRVGNADYARQNHSYGLTTLRTPHVEVGSTAMRFHFTGKSGKVWQLRVTDRRIARIVRACQELPGQMLFQYLDGEGKRHEITSSDVNAYLKEISGEEITAKDFRTWAGTVLAARALREGMAPENATQARKIMTQALKSVAARLGNTVAVCRQCYVHPTVFDSYLSGKLGVVVLADETGEGLTAEEVAVLSLLGG